MSGGSWDYFYYRLEEVAERLVSEAHPLRKCFGHHLMKCAKALHAVEWSDSGDTAGDAWIKPVRDALGPGAPEKEAEEIKKGIKELRDSLNELLKED